MGICNIISRNSLLGGFYNCKILLFPLSLSLARSLSLSVSDEMSIFNNLDRDARMSRMYKFMFTHMRGLETRLNEVARNTSERFSQVDARLQALELEVSCLMKV